MESSYIIGMLIGPSIGGAMYQLLGFASPFLLVAAAAAILSACFRFSLPRDEQPSDESTDGEIAL